MVGGGRRTSGAAPGGSAVCPPGAGVGVGVAPGDPGGVPIRPDGGVTAPPLAGGGGGGGGGAPAPGGNDFWPVGGGTGVGVGVGVLF
jgi:translation initiation factor IF-2